MKRCITVYIRVAIPLPGVPNQREKVYELPHSTVTHKNNAIEINFRGLGFRAELREIAMREIRKICQWRRGELVNHSSGITHLYPQPPSGICGEGAFTNFYESLAAQIRGIIGRVKAEYSAELKMKRHTSVIDGLEPKKYIRWEGDGHYVITPISELGLKMEDFRALAATIRGRRGKVKSVVIKGGELHVLTNRTSVDFELILGLHKDVTHKARQRVRLVNKHELSQIGAKAEAFALV